MERGLSVLSMYHITDSLAGETDEEKERIAALLLPRVEAGEFDTGEWVD